MYVTFFFVVINLPSIYIYIFFQHGIRSLIVKMMRHQTVSEHFGAQRDSLVDIIC